MNTRRRLTICECIVFLWLKRIIACYGEFCLRSRGKQFDRFSCNEKLMKNPFVMGLGINNQIGRMS